MIDYRKLFGYHGIIMNKKVLRGFSEKTSVVFYDAREKTVFSNLMKADSLMKFYMTDPTLKRVNNMDLSYIKCADLEFLYQKYPQETGLVYCDDKLHFLYSIESTHISFICLRGEKLKFNNVIDSPKYHNDSVGEISNTELECGFNSTIIGGGCISYALDEYDFFPTCTLGLVKAISSKTPNIINALDRETLFKIQKLINFVKEKELSDWDDLNNFPETKEEWNFYNTQINDIYKCMKILIFLKTAKIKELTRLSMSGREKSINEIPLKTDIIRVDTFYDHEVNVDNPFPVRGHFRNQPYKNGYEIIYIEPFLKGGYHRRATKEILDDKEEA